MYVRKWRLLKRNRIICSQVAVNEQFCLENRNIEKNCLKKSIFLKFAWKKLKFFTNLPGKIEIFREIA